MALKYTLRSGLPRYGMSVLGNSNVDGPKTLFGRVCSWLFGLLGHLQSGGGSAMRRTCMVDPDQCNKDEIQAERDVLRARCADLEWAMREELLDCCGTVKEHCGNCPCYRALSRTSAQSLELSRLQDAVVEAAKRYQSGWDSDGPDDVINRLHEAVIALNAFERSLIGGRK